MQHKVVIFSKVLSKGCQYLLSKQDLLCIPTLLLQCVGDSLHRGDSER